MTTGTSPEVRAAARRWAAGLLGVPENATSAEARHAYFKKVREHNFLPPRSLHQALHLFPGSPELTEFDEEWLLEAEGMLHADVESFAMEFFTLSLAQRRERWDTLLSRCPSASPLRARLQALKAGLEVETPGLPLSDPFHGQLVEQLLQSFPLRPLAQATSRQGFLRKIEGPAAAVHRKLWEKAARYVSAEWPALAALDQELVQHIAKLRPRLKRQVKMHQRNQRQRRAIPAGRGDNKPWWLLWIAFLVLSGIMRSLPTYSNSSSSRSSTPSYLAHRDDTSPPTLEQLRNRAVPGPWKRAESIRTIFKVPPIRELVDPTKFDVKIFNAGTPRILQFTPRPGATINWHGLEMENGQPVVVDETILRLIGISKEQMDVLFARAAGEEPMESPSKLESEEMGPRPPKSSPDDPLSPWTSTRCPTISRAGPRTTSSCSAFRPELGNGTFAGHMFA